MAVMWTLAQVARSPQKLAMKGSTPPTTAPEPLGVSVCRLGERPQLWGLVPRMRVRAGERWGGLRAGPAIRGRR